MKKLVFILLFLLLFGSGCALLRGKRDVAGPARALVGHWRMADGGGEVYFTADGIYSFVDGRGNSGRATYRVTGEDPGERRVTVVIRLTEYNQQPVEGVEEMTVTGTFSKDYRTQTGESVETPGSPPRRFVMEYAAP
jgi:hypothetical protein